MTDTALEHLAALEALARVFVWRTAVTSEGVEHLRSLRPDLDVAVGTDPAAP